MNPEPKYIMGSYKARILPDGTISYYREILTPDGSELIGTEYPHTGLLLGEPHTGRIKGWNEP